ncbi:hypothetical protein IFM89_020885 [Coptis chinensis]|uniref:Purple acid phosphatase n=1 Tax=Coptis chinensis TaxID=261450 RepID=A0A835MFK4_9MAGN|nr:hypothetical protein IFM89_020885 [Coptis chinensis]
MALCFLFLVMCLVSFSSGDDLQRLQQQTKADGSLSFLVVGDWGRKGAYNQSQVAFQMGRIGQRLDVDFVISTGDNFYNSGLTGVDDLAFEESFSSIYTAESLQKPWYSVLGNHDYRGNVEAQLSDVLRKIDQRWLCLRSFVLDTELVEVFSSIQLHLWTTTSQTQKDHTYDWSGVNPRKQYLAKILKDVESALRDSTSKWKIVVGHHTIRSIGVHGDTPELVDQLLPILKTYNVDFYINGHDHCLEHISSRSSPIQLLTSGAGSKAWRGDIKSWNEDHVNFFYDGQGFMSIQLTDNIAKIEFYDVFGNLLYSWNSFKQLYSAT